MRSGAPFTLPALLAASLLMVTGCSATGDAEGEETTRLQLSSFLGPTTPQGQALTWYIDEVNARSDGAIEIEPFWSGSLIPGADTLTGVAQQRADMGHSTIDYDLSELPLSAVVKIPFVTTDANALTVTVNELYASNAEFANEYDSLGIVPLAFFGNPSNIVATTEPVPDMEWFAGKSMRATGYDAVLMQDLGANPVTLAIGEVYESVQRGLIDGYTSMILDTVPTLSLQEVAPYLTETGSGVYTFNVFYVNADVWESIPEDHKAILREVSNELLERYISTLEDLEDEACTTVLDAGGDASVWSVSEQERWRAEVGTQIEDQWAEDASNAGIDDPQAFRDEYLDLIRDNESEDSLSGLARCAAR